MGGLLETPTRPWKGTPSRAAVLLEGGTRLTPSLGLTDFGREEISDLRELTEWVVDANLDRLAALLKIGVEELYCFVGSERAFDARGIIGTETYSRRAERLLADRDPMPGFERIQEPVQLILPTQRAALIAQRLVEAAGGVLSAKGFVSLRLGGRSKTLAALLERDIIRLEESGIELLILHTGLREHHGQTAAERRSAGDTWAIRCLCAGGDHAELNGWPRLCYRGPRELWLDLDHNHAGDICAALIALQLPGEPARDRYVRTAWESAPVLENPTDIELIPSRLVTGSRESVQGWKISQREPIWFFGGFHDDRKEGFGILLEPFLLLAGEWHKDKCISPAVEICGNLQWGQNRDARFTSVSWDYQLPEAAPPPGTGINGLHPTKKIFLANDTPRVRGISYPAPSVGSLNKVILEIARVLLARFDSHLVGLGGLVGPMRVLIDDLRANGPGAIDDPLLRDLLAASEAPPRLPRHDGVAQIDQMS